MAKYISVLNSNLSKAKHVAIQWDDNLQSLKSNPYYTAGVNLIFPKRSGDQNLGTKQVTDTVTRMRGTATIIKLSAESFNALKLASNKAPKSFLMKIEKE